MIDVKILDSSLSSQACEALVTRGDSGGVVLFIGKVRNQTTGKTVLKLEFEAYKSMAIKELNKIADYAINNFGLRAIAIHHRVGTLHIGETAVVIACASPHRKEAFAACQYAIDTLKQTVPIWKKEFFEDGEIWVAAHP